MVRIVATFFLLSIGCSGGSDAPPQTGASTSAAGIPGRVVVAGAGLAGLTAALDLRAAGWEVVVLEARDRVGGRVLTLQQPFSGGLHAEGGGESIDDNHDAIRAMVEHYGLTLEHRPPDKLEQATVFFGGERSVMTDFVARRGGQVAIDYASFDPALIALGQGMDPDHPELFANAAALDQRSLADFLREQQAVPEAEFLITSDSRAAYAAELDQISLLFAVQQTVVVADVPDSAVETMRIQGGNASLPKAMADDLGASVNLQTPVSAVEELADRVRVTAGGRLFEAAYIILALPTPPMRAIAFQPALPPDVSAAIQELNLGPAVKVISEYSTRFWETEQLSGFTVTDLAMGVAWSSSDSYSSQAGLLTNFLTGTAATRAAAMPEPARIASFQQQLNQVYPEGAASQTGTATTVSWIDEVYTGGGYAVYKPGQMMRFWPALRAGTPRVRFAGEHLEAPAGYMESAVRSGHRVAQELGAPP